MEALSSFALQNQIDQHPSRRSTRLKSVQSSQVHVELTEQEKKCAPQSGIHQSQEFHGSLPYFLQNRCVVSYR